MAESGFVPRELFSKKKEHGGPLAVDEENLQDEDRRQEDDVPSQSPFPLFKCGLEGRFDILDVKNRLESLETGLRTLKRSSFGIKTFQYLIIGISHYRRVRLISERNNHMYEALSDIS